ncbi:MAG TPA: hypothetical protein VMV10_28390 [Pirellulales bacterium]|nr:hypothetical protein [Pirellulales bacterium]
MRFGDPTDWDDFFQQNLIPAVLAHVVTTWELMQKPGPSDWEDLISDKLYLALVNAKSRSDFPFLIRREDLEFDTDLAKETGRKDIVFFPSLQHEEIYLCLEAKRLNVMISGRRESLADKYVTEGMQRFVDGKYARFVRHGAMLAYVLDGEIDRAMKNVEKQHPQPAHGTPHGKERRLHRLGDSTGRSPNQGNAPPESEREGGFPHPSPFRCRRRHWTSYRADCSQQELTN